MMGTTTSFTAQLGARYRGLGTGGTVCLVLHYCSLLITLSFCLDTMPFLALFALASIATLWLLNKPAFVLGIAAVVAQLLLTGLMGVGLLVMGVLGDSWLGPAMDPDFSALLWAVILVLPMLCLAVNILSLVFLLVKRKAFGVGVARVEPPTDPARKDPWD